MGGSAVALTERTNEIAAGRRELRAALPEVGASALSEVGVCARAGVRFLHGAPRPPSLFFYLARFFCALAGRSRRASAEALAEAALKERA